MMRLRSPRLVLDPLATSDAPLIADELRDPELYRYLPQPIPAGAADVRALVARWAAGSLDPLLIWMNWIGIETATRTRVGLFQTTIEPAERTARIGYIIFSAAQHQGFGREGVAALVAALEQRDDVGLILAEISAANRASRTLIEALGFEQRTVRPGAGHDGEHLCADIVYVREV
ncbi:MAG: GNAT family N-acetyltransferase [Candidatus Velthaea sp.]|jgi:RimJ/RimL family protein N-acetyltransferase